MTPTTMLRAGALLAGLAVAAGAFGAHVLRERLEPRDLEIFETAVRYQMFHALALVLCAALPELPEGTRRRAAAAWCFLSGTALFSGTLYLLVLTGPRWLGAITPLGGTLMIAGWLLLAMAGLPRAPTRRQPPGQ